MYVSRVSGTSIPYILLFICEFVLSRISFVNILESSFITQLIIHSSLITYHSFIHLCIDYSTCSLLFIIYSTISQHFLLIFNILLFVLYTAIRIIYCYSYIQSYTNPSSLRSALFLQQLEHQQYPTMLLYQGRSRIIIVVLLFILVDL